jgi:heme exporter protein C
MSGKSLRTLSLRTLSLITAAVWVLSLGLVFFYAPLEEEQGFLQKIFYVHVPIAIVSLCGFVLGGLLAIVYLRTRDARWDLRSYVAIHMSLIFGVGVLVTGSIWAKGSWGHWWVWNEPTLVSYLIVFLLYATYQPLRFSIEDPERQARYAAVFAIVAGAFVPMNFLAVRLSSAYLHPRVLGSTSNLPAPMAWTFLVSLLAMALLFATLCKCEITVKQARWQVRALRRKVSGEVGARGRSAAPAAHVPPTRRPATAPTGAAVAATGASGGGASLTAVGAATGPGAGAAGRSSV